MTCIDDPFYCYEYYKKRAYADETKKVCIDWGVCYDDYHGFNDWYKCVTALQCKNDDGFAYLYPDERACSKSEPEEGSDFDLEYKRQHIYKCSDYFDLTGEKIACVSSTQCTLVKEESTSRCLRVDQCYRSAGYLYQGTGGKFCVGAYECKSKYGYYAYGVTRECSPKTPVLAGNLFVNRYETENFYQCISGYASRFSTTQGWCVQRGSCYRLILSFGLELCSDNPCDSSHKLEETLNQCVEDCPQWVAGTENKCVPSCPPELPIVSETHQCKTCAQIDPNKPYREKDHYVCYEDCDRTEHRYLFYINGSYTCYEHCTDSDEHWYFNHNSHICMRQCLPGAPFHLPDGYECYASCPDLYEYFEWNGTTCYGSCKNSPNKFYFHTETGKECRPACEADAWYHAYNDTVCASSCAAFGLPYHAAADNVCYERCEDSDLGYYVRDTFTCLDRCPPGMFYNGTEGECTKACEGNNLYYVSGDTFCQFRCPKEARYHLKGDHECHAACPPGSVHEQDRFVCFLSCAETDEKFFYSVRNGRVCYPNCKAAGPEFWVIGTFTCLESCPPETYREGDGKVCYENCSQTKNSNYSVPGQWRCVDKCELTDYQYHIKDKHECRADCGSLFFDKGSFECIEGCGEGRFYAKDGHECDTQCPPGYDFRYEDQQICYKECPGRFLADAKRCVYACEGTYGLEVEDTHECVETCRNGRVQKDNLCVNNCTDGLFYVIARNKCEP